MTEILDSGETREEHGCLDYRSHSTDDFEETAAGASSQHAALSGSRSHQVEEAANRGGFSGTVGTKEAEDSSCVDFEVNAVEGESSSSKPRVMLAESFYLYYRHGPRRLSEGFNLRVRGPA